MTNYMTVFYWLTVADNAKLFFGWFIGIFTFISVISIICLLVYRIDDGIDSDGIKFWTPWMRWSVPFMVLFWALYIFTPSKKDSLLIIAGGGAMNFLTTDSVSKQIPHELSTFIVSELKNMASDSKVELGLNEQKDKILKEAKHMSSKELIEKIKNDTTFAKVVLDKN